MNVRALCFRCFRAICGEPSNIKCQLTGSNSVRMGETLTSDIQVNVTDHHGNTIKKVNMI